MTKAKATQSTIINNKPKSVDLSQKQVVALFGVTPMTIYHWRTKEVAGRPVIPHTNSGVRLNFPSTKVTKWAAKHGVEMARTLDDVLKMGLENRSSGRPASKAT